MSNPKFHVLLAGNPEAWEREEAEKRTAFKEKFPWLCGDDNLCAIQSDQARRGRLSARLMLSLYGWTVRYASGLQNFEILFSSRDHNPAAAIAWANAQPEKREFYADKTDVESILCSKWCQHESDDYSPRGWQRTKPRRPKRTYL